MGDFGAKVTRLRADVTGASDDQLLFNSGWPTLKIAFQGLVTISGTTSSTVVTHNLGYPPAFFIYRVTGNTSKFDSYGTVYNGSAGGAVAVNSTEMKFFSYGVGTGNVSFYYYIFAQPLNQNFTADTISATTDVSAPLGVYSDDYGIKVTKDGYSTDSTDLRHYAIHSGTISPNVHIAKTGACTETGIVAGGAKMLSATHNLGYEPLALFYVDYGANGAGSYTSGYYYMLGGVGGVAYVRAYTSSTSAWVEEDYSLGGFGSSTATPSILVLKEPFNTVNGYSITNYY